MRTCGITICGVAALTFLARALGAPSPARAGEFRSALKVVRPAHNRGAASADDRASGTAIRPLTSAIIASA